MTITSPALLADLQRFLPRLEADIRARAGEAAEVEAELRAEWDGARRAERTSAAFEVWCDERVTQAAVAWVLACVFVRFCEDNDLTDHLALSGPAERRRRAEDTRMAYVQAHPLSNDRDFLVDTFEHLAVTGPVARDLFDRHHSLLWKLTPSADACGELRSLFRRLHDDGTLVHDFTDPAWDTRFLGDLYQDLSADIRKQYALLQTPVFVEELILERTLEPAIATFGLADTTLIDPTCGSGHFLLGAFDHLLEAWQKEEPATPVRELARRALGQVYGVDLNPYAVAIARFRLLLAALKACGVRRMADAPNLKFHLAVGDSLLHGVADAKGQFGFAEELERNRIGHVYTPEDPEALEEILGRRHAAVVGNPPYITVKDKALNDSYRRWYETCHRQYSLAVPFTERFWNLAGDGRDGPAGYIGMITANSFMKREFGKKLVEQWFPKVDLTHVIDTSGAYIPGHGTPTVVVLGRNQRPASETVRMVLGIRGEPGRPANPAKGLVWTAIVTQFDDVLSESTYVSVNDTTRTQLRAHPWSIGGGGAAELKEVLGTRGAELHTQIEVVGRTTHTGLDEAYFIDDASTTAATLAAFTVPLVTGEGIRDFTISPQLASIFPYDQNSGEGFTTLPARLGRFLWPLRYQLQVRMDFGQTPAQRGLAWWSHSMFFPDRYRSKLGVAFAFVATHNHFVLDRGGKVFKQSAPVIQLVDGRTEEDHLGMLGLLNSAIACFWMKQVFHNKGASTDIHGARVSGTDSWDNSFEFDGTKLQSFPLPARRPVERARSLDVLAQRGAGLLPAAVCAAGIPTRKALDEAHADWAAVRAVMIAAQEELDWECLRLYGVVDEDLCAPPESVPPLALGKRAFEIMLARKVAAGEETAWFTRHRSTPITQVPAHWPDEYRRIVERRIELIETDRNVGLIERPECKRRWATEPWEEQEEKALRGWLLDWLEAERLWSPDGQPRLISTDRLADLVRTDGDWVAVAELWTGRDDPDLADVVRRLCLPQAVPAVAAARYTEDALRKRAVWEEVWDLQRREDAGETVNIPVPPKYTSADFRSKDVWSLRGKLDVPKERFVLLPGAERDTDRSPVLGWAGWDHLQQVQALAAYALERRELDGWDGARLTPLLAAWDEILPWVRQWHNDVDPTYGQRLGDYYTTELSQLLAALGLTRDELLGWRPVAATRGRKKKTAT